MMISIIVAVSENNVIGYAGKLPWHLPADLARFKRITTDHHVIMGRKTYESIGKPLAGRTNIVVTRNPLLSLDGAIKAYSLGQAINLAEHNGEREVMIIGGEQLFALALPITDRIYLTRVRTSIIGDAFFHLDMANWKTVTRKAHLADSQNQYPYDFYSLCPLA